MKMIFSENGVPAVVFSNQGPQLTSSEFQKFAQKYGFKHQTSSLRYLQQNDFVKAMVKTVRKIMKKADASGQDQHLAMLAYRSTPIKAGASQQQEAGRDLSNQRISQTIWHDFSQTEEQGQG